MLVTAGFILVGVLIDLGWKEISSGYKRNYQNVNKLDEFQSKIELQESQLIFHQMEKEYRGLLESDSNWIPYWNSTEGIVDSKPLSGLIYITEVPMVRIRANCSCNSPQTLLRQIFSTAGMLLLQSVIIFISLSDLY